MTPVPRMTVRKLARFGLTTTDADLLAAFYEHALGFRKLATDRLSGVEFESLMDVVGGAKHITLGLGDEIVELLEFDRPGKPYPNRTSSSDLTFQHFAIVVTDIAQAFQRLSNASGWTAISRDGPQQLPESSGGVTAFKFRDLDGHPLELLAFPAGKAPARWKACSTFDVCLGIDHSAICVADSEHSIAFYEGIGLCVSARSINQGPTQERLDALRDPRVEVTALSPRQRTPHIELLCYGSVAHERLNNSRNNDIVATRLVLEADWQLTENASVAFPQSMIDPDGHHLVIMPRAEANRPNFAVVEPFLQTGADSDDIA